MPFQTWQGLVNEGFNGAGSNLTTAVTATISQQVGGKDFTFSFGQFRVNSVFRVSAQGFLTTTATSTTATIFLAAGASNTTLATPVGITTGTTVVTGIQWWWESYSRVTALASSGNTISTQGRLVLGNSGAAVPANPIALTGTAAVGPLFAPNASGETAAAIDTSGSVAVMMRGTLAGANATVALTQMLIELLN